MGMAHQAHECREANAGPHHVCQLGETRPDPVSLDESEKLGKMAIQQMVIADKRSRPTSAKNARNGLLISTSSQPSDWLIPVAYQNRIRTPAEAAIWVIRRA